MSYTAHARHWTEWADRLYTGPRANVSHVQVWGSFHTVCGRDGVAYGTGTWDEREHATSLPLCRRCADHVGEAQ